MVVTVVARLSLCAGLLLLALSCSGDKDATHSNSPSMLEGDLCVDAADPCCCEMELGVSSPGGPTPCRYGFGGPLESLTFEIITPRRTGILTQVASEAACSSNNDFYVTTGDSAEMLMDLCPATCSDLRNGNGRIRPLLGCPAQAC